MHIVVYADFNCPYSWLASARADVLGELGVGEVEWRAVEHEPSIPAPGDAVEGARRQALDGELEEIRGLLRPDEPWCISRPPVMPNTALAIGAFAAAPPDQRPALRRRLFTALWVDGRDIGDPFVLRELGVTRFGPGAPVSAWRDAWTAVGRGVVPTVVLPDGDVERGREALAWLARVHPPTGAPRQHRP